MSRFLFVFLLFLLIACSPPIESTIQPTAIEAQIELLPSPTQISPTATSTSELQLEPTPLPPTATSIPPTETAVSPTETPASATIEVVVTGDCLRLERPFVYTQAESNHQFESLVAQERCALDITVENGSFEVSLVEPTIGLYGTLLSHNHADLIRIDFDGSIYDLGVPVGPFWGGRLHMIANEQWMVWGDGGFNPENEDEFVAQLMMADVNGRNQQVIYEHITDLPEKLLPEIFFPIGIHPNGDVLFSIEPAGRGGGWFYTGDSTNLYRISPNSPDKTDEDLLFECPDSPFCIGDFTDDFRYFAAADFGSKTIFIVDVETGEQVWESVEDRSFVGRPIFNAEHDLAFVAVDVIDETNLLRPEKGLINILEYPYDGSLIRLEAELASDLIGWIDEQSILYLELTSNVNGERRFPIINRNGEEIGEWDSEQRLRGLFR